MSSGLGGIRKKMLRKSGKASPQGRCKCCHKPKKLWDENICHTCAKVGENALLSRQATLQRAEQKRLSDEEEALKARLEEPVLGAEVEVSSPAGPTVEAVELAVG